MADEPIARIDTDIALVVADSTGAIVDWSDAAAALFGYSASSLLGRYFDVLVPEKHTDAAWALFEAAMGDAEATDDLDGRVLHLPVACSDGVTRAFPARVTRLRDPQGAPVAVAATFSAAVDAEAFSPYG